MCGPLTGPRRGQTLLLVAVHDVAEQHAIASEAFGRLVDGVGSSQWNEPTPCPGWDVGQLVNHVVYENRWAVPLMGGSTVEDVGAAFDGDLLGDDPSAAWQDSSSGARAAVSAPGALSRTVHLSFGDVEGEEYCRQLVADLLVHGWDLARATGADEALDPELVEEVSRWFADREEDYRRAGVIGPRTSSAGAGPAAELLAAFGRDASDDAPLSVVRRFNEAFGRHDVDAVMAMMTEDCVFEDTSPPGGRRHEGQAAVRAAWEALFAGRPRFTTEEGVVCGDRATYRWRHDYDGGHVRGVDVFRVRDGKVAEKLAYVKG